VGTLWKVLKAVFPKEQTGENRVALLPESVNAWRELQFEVTVESGIGSNLAIEDNVYEKAGAVISRDRLDLLSSGDLVLQVGSRPHDEIPSLKKNALHISFLDPFGDPAGVKAFCEAHVGAVSMEMMPRTTIAQKMDALSSQASLAGYEAVLYAADQLNRILPMMMTPAGTLQPSRVFVIGVGVAGLQAIATAKRLGARVEAFDTRPVVEEQVKSLGARFVKVDLGETGQTEQGYAKELTAEQIQKQQEAMAKVCLASDIVITTAQLFGRPAPRILTRDVIEAMRPGSVVVDMAVSSGGNVEGSVIDEVVDMQGTKVLGPSSLPGRVAYHASQMYANNVFHLVEHFWKGDVEQLNLDTADEILNGCLVAWQGKPVNPRIVELLSKES
jgi:NAD(P) transhydrogenase subunit alpha